MGAKKEEDRERERGEGGGGGILPVTENNERENSKQAREMSDEE